MAISSNLKLRMEEVLKHFRAFTWLLTNPCDAATRYQVIFNIHSLELARVPFPQKHCLEVLSHADPEVPGASLFRDL